MKTAKKKKSPKKLNLAKDNLNYYGVDCEYDWCYDCESYGCDEEGICRCGTIEDARVSSINLEYLAKNIGKFDEMTLYCVHRLLILNKLYDPYNWEIDITRGYYGEEIEKVCPRNGESLDKLINDLLELSTKRERFEFILRQEYGYVLPEIQNRRWTIKGIDKDLLDFGEHCKNLNPEAVAYYQSNPSNLPQGICLKCGDRYRVIDGYHRLSLVPSGKKAKVLMAF